GVVSYSVARRTHEIGIRMALGADRRAVSWLVLREALVLVAAGVGAGAVLALVVTRAARAMLYELAPWDPLTFILTATLLCAVACLASVAPVRKAAGVDPMAALREE